MLLFIIFRKEEVLNDLGIDTIRIPRTSVKRTEIQRTDIVTTDINKNEYETIDMTMLK